MEEEHPDRWLSREPLPTNPAEIVHEWLLSHLPISVGYAVTVRKEKVLYPI